MSAIESYWWLTLLILFALAAVLYGNRGFGLRSRGPDEPAGSRPEPRPVGMPGAGGVAQPSAMAPSMGAAASPGRTLDGSPGAGQASG